jgi:hypothetical protein
MFSGNGQLKKALSAVPVISMGVVAIILVCLFLMCVLSILGRGLFSGR